MGNERRGGGSARRCRSFLHTRPSYQRAPLTSLKLLFTRTKSPLATIRFSWVPTCSATLTGHSG